MKRSLILVSLLISGLASAADDEQVKACQLLLAEHLAPWGYTSPLLNDSTAYDVGKAEVNAPSDVHTDSCALRNMGTKQPGTTFIMVESFDEDTLTEAVAEFIKIAQTKGTTRDNEADIRTEEIHIGDAACETGAYALPTEENMAAMQHYIACDRVVGTRHVSLNMQHSDVAKLPTLLQVKELLDQAATRLPSRKL